MFIVTVAIIILSMSNVNKKLDRLLITPTISLCTPVAASLKTPELIRNAEIWDEETKQWVKMGC
jgi:hypothetical protein